MTYPDEMHSRFEIDAISDFAKTMRYLVLLVEDIRNTQQMLEPRTTGRCNLNKGSDNV